MTIANIRPGDRVRHIATGALGTVVEVFPRPKRNMSGTLLDLRIAWDARAPHIFGATFPEITKEENIR